MVILNIIFLLVFTYLFFINLIRKKRLWLDIYEYIFFISFEFFIINKYSIKVYEKDEKKTYKRFLELIDEV